MAGHAGLVQKKVNVRTKKGKTVQRSMWVRAQGAAKGVARFVGRHKGKIAAGAALVGGAALAAHHRGSIAGAARGLHAGLKQAHELHKNHKTFGGPAMERGTLARTVGSAVKGGAALGRVRDLVRHTDTTPGMASRGASRVASAARGAASSGLGHAARLVERVQQGRARARRAKMTAAS